MTTEKEKKKDFVIVILLLLLVSFTLGFFTSYHKYTIRIKQSFDLYPVILHSEWCEGYKEGYGEYPTKEALYYSNKQCKAEHKDK